MSEIEKIKKHHATIIEKLNHLREVINDLEEPFGQELINVLNEGADFLIKDLMSHAKSEELFLYPKVEEIRGTQGASTETMTYEHILIGDLVDEYMQYVQGLNEGGHSLQSLKHTVNNLAFLVGMHMAKEEKFYIPLLAEKLGDEEIREMIENMHKVK